MSFKSFLITVLTSSIVAKDQLPKGITLLIAVIDYHILGAIAWCIGIMIWSLGCQADYTYMTLSQYIKLRSPCSLRYLPKSCSSKGNGIILTIIDFIETLSLQSQWARRAGLRDAQAQPKLILIRWGSCLVCSVQAIKTLVCHFIG